MFSFEELLHEIELKRESARQGTESWDRLHAVAVELAGSSDDDTNWLDPRRSWRLERISIANYRGISNEKPLVLVFDPTPGITVIHGLNGAGKSSISDALDLALSGTTPAGTGGTAGNAALWDPVHLARGASSARVEVALSSQSDRLVLEAVLGETGEVESHVARLESVDGSEQVDLGSNWYQALASHQPVFAYASLERRVQLSKDLASYFEGLLALGGSFSALQETITLRGNASTEALSRWRGAKVEAMRALAQIDRDRRSSGNVTPLDPVPEPTINDSKEEWLNNAGLLEPGLDSDSLPTDSWEQLSRVARTIQATIQDFENAGSSVEQVLAGTLEQLHEEAKNRHLEDGTCPVCATANTGWLTTLNETVKRNHNLASLRTKVAADTKALAAVVHELLTAVLKVGSQADEADPIRKLSSSGQELLTKFDLARESRIAAQHAVLTATAELAAWLCSDEAKALVNEAVIRTDATKQWRIARARAVEKFTAIWETDGSSAAESAMWTATSSRVDDLRNHLRKRRTDALEGKAGARVLELLSDAELKLKKINALATKASMELVDQNGNRVDLGMLSAGQRNAVLLAPLLASVDAGPFEFLVLDDPVHAFDELRIDRLAGSLALLAETRRVIVLTHDDRLKEHLAARAHTCDTRLVERSAATGAVEVDDSRHLWDQLLLDARTIFDLSLEKTGSTRDVTDGIRGLCRMSIDNALRTFVLRNAVLFGRDTETDLTMLDKKYTTKERLTVAATFWQGEAPDVNPVSRAVQKCQTPLEFWNQSVHGNSQLTDATKEEIRAARDACKILAAAS
ncbi:AAA family ATPase [Arthrobacter sp. 9MFCol3.1]|uniref:AAA family ATPase n=1 Tax=Arthrobacter sp. 9MFCol3.1 TaxID=1150398 RepID=UPI0012DBD8F8|nr:AAA family ATPase [Arthrobacter sp. 9MFCol3.1]